MEAFLHALLPRIIGTVATFRVHAYQGKFDLRSKLPQRLRGYAAWLPKEWRIVVLLDRDDDCCLALKQSLEQTAAAANLKTRSVSGGAGWQLVNRIAIEELEAWYFGDWQAMLAAYPRVSPAIPNKAPYRDPDAIAGGTWELLERILQDAGYFRGGLRKIELAQNLGAVIDRSRNRSCSFCRFHDAVVEAVA